MEAHRTLIRKTVSYNCVLSWITNIFRVSYIYYIDGVKVVSAPNREKVVSSPNREKVGQYKVNQPSDEGDNGDFYAYSDPSDSNVMNIEGLVKFFTDLNIDGESVDSLYLLYVMDTEELN